MLLAGHATGWAYYWLGIDLFVQLQNYECAFSTPLITKINVKTSVQGVVVALVAWLLFSLIRLPFAHLIGNKTCRYR